MPASGALGPFLSSMMELRSQRLREQEAKEQAMADMGKSIASGVSSLGEGLTKGMEKQRKSALVNKIAGNPDAPWGGGGMDELEIRKALGQYDQSRGLTAYQQMQMQQRDLAARESRSRYDAQQEESKARYVQSRADRQSDKYREAQADASGYYAKTRDILTKMNDPDKPLSRDQHNAYADQLRGENAAAMKQGLDIQPVSVPQFMSPEDVKAIATYEKAKQASLQPTPMMQGSGPSTLAYESAAQGLQGVTPSSLGAYGTPQYSPNLPAEPAPAYTPPPPQQDPALQQQGQQGQAGGPRIGSVAKSKSGGPDYVYRGPSIGWVPIQ